ncbi:MAG: DEAD/DEAH box helicase [Lewinellaceae bacterium]|nr:DEAD/DEAH box helicase [Phaeodactylibacter sp.]MCB9036534.1 DEAD/DEAH box helicase [Lewinellaceae bacterium]
MADNNPFEKFRLKRSALPLGTAPAQLFFQLRRDSYGYFVQMVDKKGKLVSSVDFRQYSDAMRNLIRHLEEIRRRESFTINWEKPSGEVYLMEHEYLMALLKRAGNLVDKEMQPLHFAEGAGRLELRVEEEEGKPGQLRVQPSILHEGRRLSGFQALSASWVLEDGKLLEILPAGENFEALPYFDTRLPEQKLSLLLSLFFSNIDNGGLHYSGYQLRFGQEPLPAQPYLAFEQVDENQALYLRVGHVLPGLQVGDMEQFGISRYADIREMEQTVEVRPVEQEPLESLMAQLRKALRQGRGKANAAIEEDNLFIVPAEIAGPFIYEELPALLGKFRLYGAEKLRSYRVRTEAPKLNFNLSHGIDFLEGEARLDFDGQEVSLLEVLRQYQKQHYVLLSDGTHAILEEAYIRRLQRLFQKKDNKVRVSFFDLPAVEDLLGQRLAESSFPRARAVFEGFNEIESRRMHLPELNAELRPYQKYGYKWMRYLHENHLGGCLADDMGLGKTIQAIALLAFFYPKEQRPSLIVMPRTLLFNWRREIERFAPQLSASVYYGNNRNLEEALQSQLVLTTYGLVRNDIEQLKEKEFAYVILDESQNIKNLQSQVAKAVMLLQAEFRLALSGTPLENNLGELYSLFRFLNPAMFGSAKRFNDNYLLPIQRDNDPDAIRELRQKIYPFILRRLKKDVLDDLPDKIEQTLLVEMSEEQLQLYEQRRLFYRDAVQQQIASAGINQSRFFILQALSELRQLASVPESQTEGQVLSPKREALMEHLSDTIANGHKALVFCNFLASLELIGEQLEEMGIDYVSMSGATRDRQSLVNRFQEDPACKAFLMTLKTGGTGLNLTAADTIFIYDPWWNIAAEQQAIDRAHRIGQTSKVLAYRLITQGSIEEKIQELQERKRALFDQVIGADAGALKALSEDDIDYILS